MFSKVNCDDIFMKALHFERMYGNQEELESTVSSIAKKQEENIRKEQKEAVEKEKAQKRAEKQSKKIGKKEFKVMRFHFIPFFSCYASRKKLIRSMIIKSCSLFSLGMDAAASYQ